jgi:hypothetical protein
MVFLHLVGVLLYYVLVLAILRVSAVVCESKQSSEHNT